MSYVVALMRQSSAITDYSKGGCLRENFFLESMLGDRAMAIFLSPVHAYIVDVGTQRAFGTFKSTQLVYRLR